MIPLMEEEIVNKNKFIKKTEFLDLISVAQACPGVFALNVAIFTGYKLLGVRAAILSGIGVCFPSFIIILLIAIFFRDFRENEIVSRVFYGLRPAVVALIAVPVFNTAKSAGINLKTVWIPIVSAALIWLLGVSPVLIIIAAAAGGYFYGRIKVKNI